MNRITVDDAEGYVTVEGREVAPKTLNDHLNLLHAISKYGQHHRRRCASSNPVAEIGNPRRQHTTARSHSWTPRESSPCSARSPMTSRGPR